MTTTKKDLICYSTDASRIIGRVEKTISPKTAEEVIQAIKLTNLDIVPRGAGSGLVGGTIPRDSLVIDMGKMNKIIDFNISKRYVIVESGITLKELNEKLNSRGLEFPIDPTNNGISTIGGMIATNASGRRNMRYGSMKDFVEEVEFVNGRGEIIKLGKADINDVCGMEGVTGIILTAKLKLIPITKCSISVFQSDSIDECLSIARRLKLEKDVISLELFSAKLSKMLDFPEKYNLLIEFASDRGKIKGLEYKKIDKKIDRLYYKLSEAGYINREDPKLFYDKLKDFIVFLESYNIPFIGYLGSGIIVSFYKEDEKKLREETLNLIKKNNGKLGKFGYGLTRKHMIDPFDAKLLLRVKHRYDPAGKFNKGKFIDETVGSILQKKDDKEKPKGIYKYEEEEKDPVYSEPISEIQIDQNKPQINSNLPEKYEDIEVNELDIMIKDYKDTFASDEVEANRKQVEKFAKNVSKEIIMREQPVMRPRPSFDYKEINKIMTNRTSKTEIASTNIESNKSKEINNILNNDHEKTLEKQNKKSTSEEDKDLINRIMTNKFGFSNNESKDNKNDSRN